MSAYERFESQSSYCFMILTHGAGVSSVLIIRKEEECVIYIS